jgi:hypothetical protein
VEPAPRSGAGLARAPRLGLYAVGLGLWLSGALWLLFHHFLPGAGPLGPAPHPLERWWLALHGAFGFVAIWTLGWLGSAHVGRGWATGRRRASGGVLIGLLCGLTLSAYLLYYAGDEQLRALASLLHWSVGLLCPIAFALHRWRRRKRRNSAPSERRRRSTRRSRTISTASETILRGRK